MDISALIPAGIALFSSLLTIIVTEEIKFRHEKSVRKNQVISKRIDKIEDGANTMLEFMDRIGNSESLLPKKISLDDESINQNFDVIQSIMDEIHDNTAVNSRTLIAGESLDNKNLNNQIEILREHFIEFLLSTKNLFSDIFDVVNDMKNESEEYDINSRYESIISKYKTESNEIENSVKNIYADLIKELDKMRMEL